MTAVTLAIVRAEETDRARAFVDHGRRRPGADTGDGWPLYGRPRSAAPPALSWGPVVVAPLDHPGPRGAESTVAVENRGSGLLARPRRPAVTIAEDGAPHD